MKKIIVRFPGLGYTIDRPLLYYSGKIAMQHDYELIDLSFEGLSRDILTDHAKMVEAFGKVSDMADEQLKDVDLDTYDDVIFASKSIGTVAASVYAHRHNVRARQVYFTPLEQTFSLIEEGNGLVFTGTKDQYVDHNRIVDMSHAKKLRLRIIKDANHSLETGDVQTDLVNMKNVINETENYLVGSPIYDISVQARDGSLVSMRDYKDSVLLIVNTATGCGFTPQYEALEALYRRFEKDGFYILDFPCNQFGKQAPGTNDEIHSFCASRYDISFPQFAKIDVNGADEADLFRYLKSKQDFKGFLKNTKESIYLDKMISEMHPDYLKTNDIKWNFTKFLVDRNGQVTDRFEPDAGVEIVAQAVARALG